MTERDVNVIAEALDFALLAVEQADYSRCADPHAFRRERLAEIASARRAVRTLRVTS